jgi:tRNA pseudouridine32 synthase/23S rRNA pseudouridine746 synthase
VIEGAPEEDQGLIDMPLGKRSTREEGWRMTRDPAGKPARTHWQVVDRQGARTMLLLRPETGRTHQIRVHAAEGLGFPIVGDPVYGKGGEPMLLHAWKLVVPRVSKPPITAEAPLPERFARAGFGVPATIDAA